MHYTQGWYNLYLLLLDTSIFIYSVTSFLLFLYLKLQKRIGPILNSIVDASDMATHWIITATYIKASFETRMLINKNTYIKPAAELF